MDWIYLLFAGAFEIVWALGLKYTAGFTRLLPSVLTIGAMAFSFVFLSLALRNIPIGTAYAVWTGIGVIGTAIAGIILFNEPRDILRLACIVLIIAGIAGLKLTSGH
ncbi:MAG: molecular chaperone [Deltaproteobacteria bacterium GWB2_55_19]|nr:MAG: molecular chaperone [Deltaproteobacteria bacterium GWB2_55_19]HAO93837.1 quaternary ammonium compound-resistance protein SugE [Deltaproteobacteria bacterium]